MVKIVKTIIFLLSNVAIAQLHHQTFSINGTAAITSKGVVISQSIGQQSIAGTFVGSNYIVQQGFQQSLLGSSSNVSTSITPIITNVTVAPNPFTSYVNFEFSRTISTEVKVAVYDSAGRLVYNIAKTPVQNILTLNGLEILAKGVYLVSLKTTNYNFNTKIIKQ
jgi:hypothetical protein